MFEIIKSGGIIIWPILLCSIVALAIALERFWALKRESVAPSRLLSTVEEMIRNDATTTENIETIRRSSPLGQIIATGLDNASQHRVVMKESVEEQGRHVVHNLQRNLNLLGTIATISPLLGLLGTVIGMIKVFSQITAFGVGDATALAGGISEALITTAAGLSVGIPALMVYRHFRSKINELAVTMEQQTLHLISIVYPDASNGR